MKTLRRYIRTALLAWALICALHTSAQTDAQFSQFYELPSFYNPAAIGLTDNLRIRGGARLQWVGIDNAPMSFTGVADMPLKLGSKRIGLGLLLSQESQGLYHSLNIDAQIGYKFRKFGGEWTVGLGIGLYDQAFKGSKVYLPGDDEYHQSGDDAIPTMDIHGTGLDLSGGIWYQHKLFHAGVGMTHANSPTVSMVGEGAGGAAGGGVEHKYTFTANRTLYFIGGCNIPLKNTLFELTPSVMVKSDFTFTGAEIMARARYRKLLSFGVGYRTQDAIIATVSVELKNFFIGYSYDYATTAIHRASSGSHEITLGYSMKLDLGDKNKHRHKSVRIM